MTFLYILAYRRYLRIGKLPVTSTGDYQDICPGIWYLLVCDILYVQCGVIYIECIIPIDIPAITKIVPEYGYIAIVCNVRVKHNRFQTTGRRDHTHTRVFGIVDRDILSGYQDCVYRDIIHPFCRGNRPSKTHRAAGSTREIGDRGALNDYTIHHEIHFYSTLII